jgi:Xaa-Pro aminopeptidase
MAEDVLLYGSPDLDSDLFHAVPVSITDPFLYVETRGRPIAVLTVMDADNARAAGVEVLDPARVGRDDLIAEGLQVETIETELCVRVCRELGVRAAAVPFGFPIAVADALRSDGVHLEIDQARFVARRRIKTPAELAGIRRAQAAADAAMGVAADLVRDLRDGLTCEDVRAAIIATFDEHGCEAPFAPIVGHGPQTASAHDDGSGPIAAGEPVIVDIAPRDRRSRCWTDMTRTFVAGGGEPDKELARYFELTRESLSACYALVRDGADGRAIFDAACEPYERAGLPTLRTKKPGELLVDGFYHGLGHGIGLDVHERPNVGRTSDVLQAGDVMVVEPGCYRHGYGGCRLEEALVVTEDGYEPLTAFPYDL